MLERLYIKNYILIDELEIQFSPGLNVMSGETGTGKSILLEALGLLLGGRGNVDAIRKGADEALVAMTLRIAENSEAVRWLKEREIAAEEGEIIIRRILKSNGRSSARIQSCPVVRKDLEEFGNLLFDLHSQHEHQSLFTIPRHRELLDRYGGLEPEVNAFQEIFEEMLRLKQKYEVLQNSEEEEKEKRKFREFAAEEIAGAKLKIKEDEQIRERIRVLERVEEIKNGLDEIKSGFFGSREAVLPYLRNCRKKIEKLRDSDPNLRELQSRFDNLFFELEDWGESLKEYEKSVFMKPDELQENYERLSLINTLKQKYGKRTPEELLNYCEECREELKLYAGGETPLEAIGKKLRAKEEEVFKKASALSGKREKIAAVLQEKIQDLLRELGMKTGVFHIERKEKRDEEGQLICRGYGIDRIEFLLSVNKGESLKSLVKVASGGELSRVMLAIKSILSAQDFTETLIFDEVDTGIGGRTARIVGKYMKKLASGKQVLCVTHLASIAVFADNHLSVSKEAVSGRILSRIRDVKEEERVKEIARMLSGRDDEVSLEHAKTLLSEVGSDGEA